MLSLAQNYLTRSFWGDEAWTSLISQLPYGQMLKTTAADFHPPGFYTVVELVYKVLPPTEIVTRSITIVFYLLTAYMVFKLASEIRGKPFGFLSAVVVALNPIFFRYAFEARNYTMFAFAVTASMYFLIKLSKQFTLRRAISFVLFTTLGLYTHYYMFFILAAQGLYLILFDRKIFLKMMAAYVAVFVLFAFWIPFLIGQLQSAGGSYWISPIDWQNTHFDAFRRIFGGEKDNYYQLYLYRFSVLLCLVGFLQHVWKRAFEKPYLLIWLWAIVPFVLATLPGLQIDGFKVPFRPIFFWRYLIPAAVPLSIILAYATVKLPRYLYLIPIVIVIATATFIDYNTFFSSPTNFKQAYFEKVMPNIRPSDKIVTTLPSFAEVFYYRNRNGLKNDFIVLPEGLVQYSGKSLLDAYVAGGVVKIADHPKGRYWQLTPGPSVELRTSNLEI